MKTENDQPRQASSNSESGKDREGAGTEAPEERESRSGVQGAGTG
jgi:hypothetical protein